MIIVSRIMYDGKEWGSRKTYVTDGISGLEISKGTKFLEIRHDGVRVAWANLVGLPLYGVYEVDCNPVTSISVHDLFIPGVIDIRYVFVNELGGTIDSVEGKDVQYLPIGTRCLANNVTLVWTGNGWAIHKMPCSKGDIESVPEDFGSKKKFTVIADCAYPYKEIGE